MRPVSRQVAFSNGLLNWLDIKHYFERLSKIDSRYSMDYTPEPHRRFDYDAGHYVNEIRQCFRVYFTPAISPEYTGDPVPMFKCLKYEADNRYWFNRINTEMLRKAKLWVDSTYTRGDMGNSLTDALYYKIHPEKVKIKYRDGRLTRGFWSHLDRRMKGMSANNWVTKYMFLQAIRWIKNNVSRDNEEVLRYFHSMVSARFGFGYCWLTNKWSYGNVFQNEMVSGVRRQILNRIRLEDYGYIRSNYQYHTPDEVIIEGECYKRSEVHYEECVSCGTDTLVGNLYHGECYSCLPDDYKIQGYGAKAEDQLEFKARRVKLQRGSDITQYFGIELEYEVPNKQRKAQMYVMEKLLDHAIMKYDGSIRNGFEIVTCPATFDIHKERMGSFLDNLPPEFDRSSSTGMHVHISRRSLTKLGIGKMTEFLNRLDNQTFVRKIAGRNSNNYQKANSDYTIKRSLSTHFDRYNNINLQNSQTIELRIFSTPLTKEDFNVKLEFCKALADYCQPSQQETSLKESTSVKAFMSWLTKMRYDYKNLFNFINKEIPSCV